MPKRTPKERLRLALALLALLFVANFAASAMYKVATQWQVDLLTNRAETLARIDPDDGQIPKIKQLIETADYISLFEPAPRAIAKRQAIKTYLQRHPHVVMGVATDGADFTGERITGLLRAVNQSLRPHRLSVGLSGPLVEIKLPTQATREDVLQGITPSFGDKADFVLALIANRCRYTSVKAHPHEPTRNRIYSFGWRGLAVVDGAVLGAELNTRLQIELVRFLEGEAPERRWRLPDYERKPAEVLANHQIVGRVRRGGARKPGAPEDVRTVRLSIGLDQVAPANARAAIAEANAIFQPMGVRFVVEHLHPHRLADEWKWPVEMKRLLTRGQSDLYVLLTDGEWVSPERGLVRGLANATVGAVLVQAGTLAETSRRLAHELGHLFNLPHTLRTGHIMYPNEDEIRLTWSPGSKRFMARNRLNARWYSSILSPERYAIASRLAPVMRRARVAEQVPRVEEAFASGDVWASCGAG